MNILEQYINPDGELKLEIVKGDDDEIAIGYEGGSWHTHLDLISLWFSVPMKEAKDFFVEAILNDKLPIITSVEDGEIDPWVSDNLEGPLTAYGKRNCTFRRWSGEQVDADKALKIYAASRGAP